ncbi:MAG: succinylglutamate desuccinylase/aspartoacylase family protein [Planctomycetota bacterium]
MTQANIAGTHTQLVVTAGMHGNEPGGIQALERVFARLREGDIALHGELIGYLGNRTAVAAKSRYMHEDFNRIWLADRVEALIALDSATANGSAELNTEEQELIELLEALNEAFARTSGPKYFMDIHSSSADGVPFAMALDTSAHRDFAEQFEVPILLGILEQLDGCLLEYVERNDVTTIGFEGGQHDAPSTVDNSEAAIWLALAASGIVDSDCAEVQRSRQLLAQAAGSLPQFTEIRYRHAIEPEDRFRMLPGFESFEKVKKSQAIAEDRNGPVTVRETGRLLLPLYQGLGDDGFFIGRELTAFRRTLADGLRSLGIDRLLPLIPGVRRANGTNNTLHVNLRAARYLPRSLFYRLGYRHIRRQERGWHLRKTH